MAQGLLERGADRNTDMRAERRRVLIVHNRYQQPGGEDVVFEAEADLLERHGHAVTRLVFDNDDILRDRSALAAGRLAVGTVWSRAGAERVRDTVRRVRPEVVHFHNTLPLVSPAAYLACKQEGVAVVQTLHNYRLLCPSATLFRDGRVCEDCIGRFLPWPGVRHGCYRGSRPETAAVAAMLTTHRALGSFQRWVDTYIALTDFGRTIFVAGGLPFNKVAVKPNFVDPDPGPGPGDGGFALFVGRLTAEKGIETLLAAWRSVGHRVPLRVVGDGPLAPSVAAAAADQPGIRWLGQLPSDEVLSMIGQAAMLIFPSLWYEGQGRTVVESFAVGTPVVTSNLGTMRSVIRDGETGFHFTPGDAVALATTVERAWADPGRLRAMRSLARQAFEETFTAAENYRLLTGIYETAITVSRGAAIPNQRRR